VYFFLTSALNDLFIERIREFWSHHPRYQDLVGNIQGKYVFDERPQRGMVIKTSGGSNVRLTWDNYQGMKESYLYKARVGDHSGWSLEWVREDKRAVQDNGGVFPSPPGVYRVSIVDSDLDADGVPTGRHQFQVDSVLDVTDEAVAIAPDRVTGFLQNPYVPGTLRIFELPSNFELVEGVNFTGDPETGQITLGDPLPTGLYLSADYRYDGGTTGPFNIESERAHYEAIPGAILAFGRRITPGDQIAVVVTDRRENVAKEYGGRWDLSVEIDLWARDVDDQREMTDLMLAWLPSVLRDQVAMQGVWITSVDFGGETEEPYDDNSDDYFYGATISIQTQTDWQLWVPLPIRIKRVFPLRADQVSELAGLSDAEIAQIENNLQLTSTLHLQTFEDPFFANLARQYATIR